jgi:hypothetical protein
MAFKFVFVRYVSLALSSELSSPHGMMYGKVGFALLRQRVLHWI